MEDYLLKEIGIRATWLDDFQKMVDPIKDQSTLLNCYTHKCHEQQAQILDMAALCTREVDRAGTASLNYMEQVEMWKRKYDGAELAQIEFFDRLCSGMIHDPVSGMLLMLRHTERLHAIQGDGKVYPDFGWRMRLSLAWRLLIGKDAKGNP